MNYNYYETYIIEINKENVIYIYIIKLSLNSIVINKFNNNMTLKLICIWFLFTKDIL